MHVTVSANHDPDAQVWWVEETTLPGLRLEADSLDRLVERLPDAVLDLLETQAVLDGLPQPSPRQVTVVVQTSRTVPLIPAAA
jgi:hypothetical protein